MQMPINTDILINMFIVSKVWLWRRISDKSAFIPDPESLLIAAATLIMEAEPGYSFSPARQVDKERPLLR
jgi:hypothetical protein